MHLTTPTATSRNRRREVHAMSINALLARYKPAHTRNYRLSANSASKPRWRRWPRIARQSLAADLDCFVDLVPRTAPRTVPRRSRNGCALPERSGEDWSEARHPLALLIASIARAHAMLGIADRPTTAPIVRDTLKAARRRRGAEHRQAAPLCFGDTLDPETSGLTIKALLEACAPDLSWSAEIRHRCLSGLNALKVFARRVQWREGQRPARRHRPSR